MSSLRLGVNIDHVATLRNARGGALPDPVAAAHLAVLAGADSITMHLREDRRHIRDADVEAVRATVAAPLNFEMAATEEMAAIAERLRPHAACIVPERREEVTTEGGLDAAGQFDTLRPIVARLTAAGVRVSLFIDPDRDQLRAAAGLRAPVVELHTGAYAEDRPGEFDRLMDAARMTAGLGLECHAGHGLNYRNVGPIAALPEVRELNIGHFLVGEALFDGLETVVRRMRRLMLEARRAGE